jgi:hypothetical protein
MDDTRAYECCENCRFFYPAPGGRVCRRNPPVLVPPNGHQFGPYESQFPAVKPNQWCGEYEQER